MIHCGIHMLLHTKDIVEISAENKFKNCIIIKLTRSVLECPYRRGHFEEKFFPQHKNIVHKIHSPISASPTVL
jgi:hypothetical protein